VRFLFRSAARQANPEFYIAMSAICWKELVMNLRSLCAVPVLFLMVLIPAGAVSARTTFVAQALQTGTITLTVTGQTGQGLGGATIVIEGPGYRQAGVTDASGLFSVSVPAGLYTVTVNKGGYQTSSADVVLATGQSTKVDVPLTTATLNNLNVIGRLSTSSGAAAPFNISSTTSQHLTQEQITARNTPDLTQVVSELPGVTIIHASGNPQQGFVIRGLRYETKVTLDGHPVSSGTSGIFLTDYASAGIFGGIDVVKGAGLNGPTAGESGVGTVNLRTPDFTAKDSGVLTGGLDNYGGSLYTALVDVNFLPKNKLSFIFGRTFSGYRGPTYDQQEPDYVGATIAPMHDASVPQNLTNGVVQYVSDFSDTYSLNAELAKMRYQFSDTTSLTLEFLGLQGRFDPQGGAYGQLDGIATIPQCLTGTGAANYKAASGSACTVTSTYNSPGAQSLIGQSVPVYTFFPDATVDQTEPTFSADFKTTIKNDTLLFRPYSAAITRNVYQGTTVPGGNGAWYEVTNAANCQVNFVAATVANGGAKGPCFAAGVAPGAAYVTDPNTSHGFLTTTTPLACSVTNPCYTTSTVQSNSGQVGFSAPYAPLELDRLFGYTFSYIHPVGANTYNVSFDHYYDDTTSFSNDSSPLLAGCQFVLGSGVANTPGAVGYQPNCPLATLRTTPYVVPETFSSVSSLALTAQLALTSKLEFDFGGYFTHYLINGAEESPAVLAAYAPTGSTGAASITIAGIQNASSHFDPHFGLLFRPTRDLAIRFTGGSSLSIPYASLVSGFQSYAQGTTTTITTPNPMLMPEEVVALDLGADLRTPDGTVLSGDIYNDVIHNPWLSTKVLVCNCTLPGLQPTTQTFSSQTLNGAQEYAQGIEFSITHEPAVGFGYRVNTAFERAYFLDTPSSYFASPQIFFNGSQLDSTGNTNTSVPYAKGYAEIQYAGPRQQLFRFGADYEGNNNSFNGPAFWVFDAGVRFNSGFHDILIGATVENIFDFTFNSLLARGVAFQGLSPVAAAIGSSGISYSTPFSTGLVSPGPVTFRFTLTKRF
jgi:hypothetical protein